MTAWSFDRAVYMFGSTLDAELRNSTKDAKNDAQANSRRQSVIAKWLGGKEKFKDPAAAGSGAVTSKGSGPVAL